MSRQRLSKQVITMGFVLFFLAVGCSAPTVATPASIRPTNTPVPPTATQTTVINLSQDLVRLGIASQNLTPNNPLLDARPLFQAGVQYVQSHHIQLLTVDRGNYYFLTPQTPVTYLNLSKLSDLVIDLAGSTIYFKRAFLQGINLSQGQRVTLTNFQTDFVEPPYTHVELTSSDANGRRLLYKTLPEWADPSTFSGTTTPVGKPELWAVVFRNGTLVPGTSRMQIKDPISSGTLELLPDSAPWTQSSTLATLKAGDVVVVTQRVGQQPLKVLGGDAITFSNISVFGSSNWAVMFEDTSNSIVDHVKVMPRPGSGLVGSNGDGIHFFNVRQNNHIRNSYVTGTLDDAIVMDSIYIATVVRQTGPRQIRVSRRIYKRFPNGTRVNLVDSLTTRESNGAIIVSQDPPDSDSPVLNGEVDLTLDQDLPNLPPGTGIVLGTPDSRGAGSSIDDNIVDYVPFGRGIWISGAQGITVQRNSVGPTSFGGIVVSQNQPGYLGPPSHDILIQHNSVVGSLGPMASGAGSYFAVGSVIVESQANGGAYAQIATNTNITIRNNYIADSGRAGIWLGEFESGTVQDNVIVRWNRHPELPYNGVNAQTRNELMQDAMQPVVCRIACNAHVTNNMTEIASTLSGAVSLTPARTTVSASAMTGSIAVQPNVPNFAWLAVSDSPWLTIRAPAFGTGPGSVQLSVAENTTGSSRTGTIAIAGVSSTVTQEAAGGGLVSNGSQLTWVMILLGGILFHAASKLLLR
ncbi:right-handed parallel beta-helix repeat-containing protein [Candidatus Acetothermia bacterium]|nr:right-handed parallel beta-helix repeat-containing protein [Candidatus Acetothermia bacterium]MBI3461421.1 right-handed parallel beta-helix repeat-containing protein [Candidatus Acetothermia bacterium]